MQDFNNKPSADNSLRSFHAKIDFVELFIALFGLTGVALAIIGLFLLARIALLTL